MLWPARLLRRWRPWFRRSRVEAEMEAELEFHLEQEVQASVASGMSVRDAHAAARRTFGDPARVREECRDSLGVTLWDAFRRDFRRATGSLARQPGTSLAAVTILAIGIGANTAVFTVANAVLFQRLPFESPDRLVWVETRDAQGHPTSVSRQDFDDWRRSARSIPSMALGFNPGFSVSGGNEPPTLYPGGYLTGSGFRVLGVPAAAGRWFTENDDQPGAAAVAVLGHALWADGYGSDRSIIGKAIRLNGRPVTVVGVMPPGFGFPAGEQLWVPMSLLPPALAQRPRENRFYFAFGRLADGVSLEQARDELATIGAELTRQHPVSNRNAAVGAASFQERAVDPQVRTLSWVLLAAVGFVLILACSSVANLLLAKVAQQSRVTALCMALGASRSRVIRQLFAEGAILASIGALAGLALAFAGIRWFDMNTRDVGRPYWIAFTVDHRIAMFFVAVSVLTVVLCAIAPATSLLKASPAEALRDGGRSATEGQRTRTISGVLVIAQLTLTVVLLSGAGLLVRTFLQLQQMQGGLDSSHLLAARIVLPAGRYPTADQIQTFIRRLDERLTTISGVAAASTTTAIPFMSTDTHPLFVDGRPAVPERDAPHVQLASVGPHYFDTLNLPLVRGRGITESDGVPGHEVAIVNQQLATEYFPTEDPIGKRIRFDRTPLGDEWPWATIVGIVPTVRHHQAQDAASPDAVVYIPNRQHLSHRNGTQVLVRTQGPPSSVMPQLRQAVFGLDPDLPVGNVVVLDQVLAEERWASRVYGSVFATFALIGLILSGLGIYAVARCDVERRLPEIAIRRAVGATPRHIAWLVGRRAIVHVSVALGLGVAGALAVGRALSSVLVATAPWDTVTLLVAVAIVVVLSAAACLIPSRRAVTVDPALVLRD